jgi:mevalonate kinase
MTIATAPGKVILLGEHAVVYGRPAIAVPVSQVEARADVTDRSRGRGILIVAPDIGARHVLRDAPPEEPLADAVRNTLHYLGYAGEPNVRITLTSTIPIASGLGSGAAVATALVRALAAHLGTHLSPSEVSALVYETEKLHHGTPSGIDNTVVAYAQPIYFVRGRTPEQFAASSRLPLVIADSGVPSPTKVTVGDVRKAWRENPTRYEALFDEIASLVESARRAIESDHLAELGRLMNRNHEVLREIRVSSPELDRLVESAQEKGAWGAKLSGGGRGGNVIAIAPPERLEVVARAFRQAGAVHVIT